MPSNTVNDSTMNDGENVDELDDGFESDQEDSNVFRIRDRLQPPSAKLFTTKELHTLIHQGAIDLNPSYQRDVVWPTNKQIGLIDSIFRNFYIPPVVFAVQRDDDNEEVRICVDGKQRLTSIQKFIDGQIPHRDSKTKKNYWFTRPEAQKASRLEVPEKYKQEFSEKQITCVEYTDIEPSTERDLFQRVQLGMTLTVAEKLQAIASPWAEWISDLEARHVTNDDGLSHVLQWDTKRGRDFQCIAQFVYCCDGLPEQLFPTAQKMEKWLVRVDKPPQEFKMLIHNVLNEFWHIATTSHLKYGFTNIDKRLAPVEFVFVGVLLYILRNVSHEDRAKAIYAMRMRIRKQFTDIRTNSNVTKAMWAFIDSVVYGDDGGSNVDGKKGKRKRKGNNDDESAEEYRPLPVKSLGRTPKTRSRPKD